MKVLKSAVGVRTLKAIAATASSARVLDLHALAAEKVDHPDYLEHPLFMHPVLNRSIIVKHNVCLGEGDQLEAGRLTATKLIFPFDQYDLNLGGQVLFVDEKNFVNMLTRHLDYTGLSLSRDLTVLRAVDRLPTLDPFLISEVLAQEKIKAGRCYYRFSKSDRAEMLGFVSGEIEALIRSCFGEVKTSDKRTRRLSQLLLADQSSDELEPLRATFRMSAREFSDAIFAWKAFLYYRWRSRALAPLLKATLRSISGIRAKDYDRDGSSFINKAKPALVKTLTSSWREVGHRLQLYDRAFASLTDQEDPDGFRNFLMNGSSQFVELGVRIGRLEQAVSFWSTRFPAKRIASFSPDEMFDGMRDLLQALSIQTGAQATWGPGVDRRAKRLDTEYKPPKPVAAAFRLRPAEGATLAELGF